MNEIANQTTNRIKGVLFKSSIKSKKRSQRIANILSFIIVILIAALVMLPVMVDAPLFAYE